MSYVDNNLISGESVMYRVRLHWILFAKPGLVTLALIAIAVFLFYLGGAAGWIGAALLVTSAIPIIVAAVNRSSAEFAVTNKRVILKVGFIQKKTAGMFLNKVESVGVDQSIAGRVLGYGA